MFMAAMKAGKNVYVEKPLAHAIGRARKWSAWEKAAVIAQVGTQNRSSTLCKRAKEMVDHGMIGDCHFVRAFWYRNSPSDKPAWRYDIPANANESNTDWQRFLGRHPTAPSAWNAITSGISTGTTPAASPLTFSSTRLTS